MLNLIGVVIAFAFILLLIRKKFNFGLSLIMGALIVGIFSLKEIGIAEIPKAFIEAIVYHFDDKPLDSIIYNFDFSRIYTETIELAILMTLIYILAKLMQDTGTIKKLIDSLRTFLSKGGTLGVIPAIYGLMPIPGGALFSAPTIDEEGNKYKISKDEKNFLNVWFRHIWFAIYPMSSAMILICSSGFSNIDIYYLAMVNIPAFIASIAIGIFYLKRFIKNAPKQQKKNKKDYSFIIYILPPIVPLAFYGLLQFINFPQIRSFLIGVFFSIVLLYFIADTDIKDYLYIIKKSLTIKLALAIFGIMIFREMFEVSGVPAVIANGISDLAFPALAIIIVIPILLGMLTGYNLGAVALSYPLVEPFFEFTGINIIGLASIVFISSLAGYLVSPIHLCNVLSSEYMKTETTRMYKMYIPSVLFLLFVQVGVMILLFGI